MKALALALLLSPSATAAVSGRVEVVALQGALTYGRRALAAGEVVDGSKPFALADGGRATLRLPQGLILLKGPASFSADPDALTLRSGSALAVLHRLKRRWSVRTPAATASVRGTVFYVEAHEDETYLCLCRGSLVLGPAGSADKGRTVSSTRHTAFFLKTMPDGRLRSAPAPFRGHSDAEIQGLKASL